MSWDSDGSGWRGGNSLRSIRTRKIVANCLYTGTGSSGLIVTGKMVLIRQNVMIARLHPWLYVNVLDVHVQA